VPDLYGRRAWLVIGLAAAGWALAVIFMLAYVGMYYTAYHYYLATPNSPTSTKASTGTTRH